MLSRRLFNKVLFGGILFPCLPKLNLCKPKIKEITVIKEFNLCQTYTYGDIEPYVLPEDNPKAYVEILYTNGVKHKYSFKNNTYSIKNNIPYGILNFTKINSTVNYKWLVYHDEMQKTLYLIIKSERRKELIYCTLSGLEFIKDLTNER